MAEGTRVEKSKETEKRNSRAFYIPHKVLIRRMLCVCVKSTATDSALSAHGMTSLM